MKDKFLTAEEVKKLERIAGTSCCGSVRFLECSDSHSEIYDNFGLAAYLSPEQTKKFKNQVTPEGKDGRW